MFSLSRLIALLLVVSAPWASAAPPAAIFEDTLAQRMQACASCHGQQGRAGPDGYYPRIAGKPAGYLYNQLKHFQTGQRGHNLMARMVDPLSEAYLWEIAQHFASLDLPHAAALPARAEPAVLRRGEQLALRGDASRQVPACAACHGAALTGVQPATPGLLGLPPDYINAQFGAWHNGTRRAQAPDCMASIARRLPASDVAAVSAWLAAQPVPPNAAPVESTSPPAPMECGGFSVPAVQKAARP